VPEIQVQPIGDRYLVTVPDLVLEFAHVRDHTEGLAAELTIYRVATGDRHWGKLSLASPPSRAASVKAAERSGPCPGLAAILDEACFQIVQRERLGTPAAPLLAMPPSPDAWLVPGLLPLGETSILYGDGASGKSLLALALALAGCTGFPLGKAERWRVAPLRGALYLDWESRREDHAERLWGLSRIHGAGEPVETIRYRAMTRGLGEELTAVAQDCAAAPTDLVIVDSLGAAAGAEPESADAAVRTLNALRTLAPATRLVIAHVSKAAAELDKGRPKPYGSVYVSNLARSTVLALASDQVAADELTVTYHHTKVNRGPRMPARALSFAFDGGEIDVRAVDPDLTRAGLPERIIAALRDGAESVAVLAKHLGAKEGTLRSTLTRLEKRGNVVRIGESGRGRGQETQWGLAFTKRGNESVTS
jgi:archaellum biogenesis ATPase FlaH